MALIVLQCGQREALSADEVEDKLDNLIGVWQQQPNMNSYELWTRDANGHLAGKQYLIQGSDTISSDLMGISRSDSNFYLLLTAIHDDESHSDAFQLTEWTDKRFRFENDGDHFPNLIQYTFDSNDVVRVWLRGDVNGLEQNADLKYKRVK